MKKLIIPAIVLLAGFVFYNYGSKILGTSAPSKPILPNVQPLQLNNQPIVPELPASITSIKSSEELVHVVANVGMETFSITPINKNWNESNTAPCAGSSRNLSKHERNFSPEREIWLDMFLTHNARAAFIAGERNYPVGTVVLKKKYVRDYDQKKPDIFVQTPILYTGMLKRESGYNSECGDWEFFTVDGDAENLTSRGKLSKCMNCHKNYAKSDFVTTTLGDTELGWDLSFGKVKK